MNHETKNGEKEQEVRLQQRLKLLQEKFEAGKIQINPGLRVIESLKAVRYAPDGSVDLTTVDGLVRSLALAVEGMHAREELKKAWPLAKIQSTYFDFLDRNFGDYFRVMRERSLSPHDAGLALSQSSEPRDSIAKQIPDFLDVVGDFWEHAGPAVSAHIQDMHGNLKAVFGGDLFPSHDQSIASKCGIYADTILLPDPFLKSEWPFSRWDDEQKAYFFVKHAMNVLQYKSLADAELNVPIIAIVPDYATLNPQERDFYLKLGQSDALVHAEKLFGQKFDSIDDFLAFTEGLDSVDAVLSSVRDPQRILFESEVNLDAREQLKFALGGQYGSLLGTQHPGRIIGAQAIGRMSVSNELLIKAQRLGGTPVIDAPTSWQYFVWKPEYDAGRVEEHERLSNLHILRGLQSLADNEMVWLGKVPHEALIELRRDGALDEIRLILGTGVEELSAAQPHNFYRTADQIFDNIHRAFNEHNAKVRALSEKKWRFAGKDLGTWLAVGTLEVAAAATGTPVYGLSALAAHQFVDVPKLKDIPKSIRELTQSDATLKRSPVGILFKNAHHQ